MTAGNQGVGARSSRPHCHRQFLDIGPLDLPVSVISCKNFLAVREAKLLNLTQLTPENAKLGLPEATADSEAEKERERLSRVLESIRVAAIHDDKQEAVRCAQRRLPQCDRQQAEAQIMLQANILNHINDAAIAVNRESRIIYWNRAAERLYNCKSEQVLGRPLQEAYQYSWLKPEHEQVACQDLETRGSWQGEAIHRKNNGEEIIVDMSASIIKDDRGTRIGLLAIIRDITERKRNERALKERAEELEKANRVKDEFLAIVSHELRTPLNSMLGWTQMLRRQNLHPDKVEKALETIERNAKSQAKLIDDILDISRIIQGKLQLENRRVALESIVDTAIATSSLSATAKGIQIVKTMTTNIVEVMGDSDRLQQVVCNLLSNAIKFTPAGGKVEVRLSAVMEESSQERENYLIQNSKFITRNSFMPYAQIQVIDTGKGISPDFLPFVFERFRQADTSTTRAQNGLGLGLAIVRHLVQLHGGTVSVASEGEGKGAIFTVQLPLRQQIGSTIAIAEASKNSPPLGGLQILVVDDDIDTGELLRFNLEAEGAKVTVVQSAFAALETIVQLPIDVLISDIGMPEEDGYSLIGKIRSLESQLSQNFQAIALTAFAKNEDRERAIVAGFDKHIAKPIEPDLLVKEIASLLNSFEL